MTSSSGSSCGQCGETLRTLDHAIDYSTTRGPLTAYDIVVCSSCDVMSLQRSAAQATR